MNYGKLCAYAMIALSVGACIGHAVAGDYRRSAYWAFAAGTNITVSF